MIWQPVSALLLRAVQMACSDQTVFGVPSIGPAKWDPQPPRSPGFRSTRSQRLQIDCIKHPLAEAPAIPSSFSRKDMMWFWELTDRNLSLTFYYIWSSSLKYKTVTINFPWVPYGIVSQRSGERSRAWWWWRIESWGRDPTEASVVGNNLTLYLLQPLIFWPSCYTKTKTKKKPTKAWVSCFCKGRLTLKWANIPTLRIFHDILFSGKEFYCKAETRWYRTETAAWEKWITPHLEEKKKVTAFFIQFPGDSWAGRSKKFTLYFFSLRVPLHQWCRWKQLLGKCCC